MGHGSSTCETAGGSSDVAKLVQALEAREISWCMIGGLAVNHWAEEPTGEGEGSPSHEWYFRPVWGRFTASEKIKVQSRKTLIFLSKARTILDLIQIISSLIVIKLDAMTIFLCTVTIKLGWMKVFLCSV